ncbi:hypothetical protein [Phascolarctobacterium sp.]|uniref:hypothetical protein n=1 Tax=Phascolarctobacterium sp. TaxID=2049039 RepID=UPI00304DA70A
MTNKEAIETLQAMIDAMDPRFITWDREQRKVEALSMAIGLLKRLTLEDFEDIINKKR